uniref:Retrotransposon gag domain-containing protein n=1 Tax=Tanacetum cinerariifolium TaxID=118510 RepID=A0A6L2LNC8_TANCI|nr:hypothetical protein [Tanacetum cinerariifolium]
MFFKLRSMASDSDQDARYALSKLLQRGTVAEYESEFLMLIKQVTGISESLLKLFYNSGLKPALQCELLRLKPALQIELLRERPTSLEEAFSLARITEARFEDERSTTAIAKTKDLNKELPFQDFKETIHHKPNKVEAVKTKKDDAKPLSFADAFGVNGGNDSETTCLEVPMKEVMDSGIESKVVVGLSGKFQEGYIVDALLRVEQKSLGNWKELDTESEDRKVEMDAKREGEPTILAIFGSDRGKKLFFELRFMESDGSEQDVRYELSKLLQRGTVPKYESLEEPIKEVVENGIKSEVVVGLPGKFQGDMVDTLSRVELKSLGNWKELDNESKDRKVEMDAKM